MKNFTFKKTDILMAAVCILALACPIIFGL